MSQSCATPDLFPELTAGAPVFVGERFEFTGDLARPGGPTGAAVTDITVTGMVVVRLLSPASKFDQFASVPLERVELLLSAGMWVREVPGR